jgi:DivIVA domain-containing protein
VVSAWVKRYSVRQRRFWVKVDQRAGATALAGPGGTGDSTADPPDSDAAGWAVPAVIRASVEQQPSESAPDSEVDGAILAEWVDARRFSTTRLRPGYDEEEVDTFLDEAESRLAAQASARAMPHGV